MSRFVSLLAAVLSCGVSLTSQTTTTAQNYNVQVSRAQPWTDTGLDLKSGDSVQISLVPAPARASGCDASVATQTTDLPLPSAPAGVLLAKLHSQGATPLQVSLDQPLHIEEASHLFLGFNNASAPSCPVVSTFSIHVTPAGSTATTTEAGQQARGTHLKSELGAAAQIFMSGQFGMGKSESNSPSSGTANAPTLNVSTAPLDADLRQNIDSLPRRVNDQFKNLGDMVNFVIVGNEKDVQAALDAASWHVADVGNSKAVLNALEETYQNKDYLTMPMSTLYLFGRQQDFGYEMAEPIAMVASRHHFRIWKAAFTWQDKEVWVGAGTHDIGFAKDKRNGEVTHKIDPAVDGERDNIGSSLQKANKTKTVTYYLPPDPVQDAKNATGDGYHSDGRLIVIFLQ